jgi:hypothetical protein
MTPPKPTGIPRDRRDVCAGRQRALAGWLFHGHHSAMAIERTNSFHLLLSDDELKLLKLLAEREGLNASDYLRMLIRTMPSTSSPNLAQLVRLAATLGGLGGKVDMAKLFDAHSAAAKLAKPNVEETKRKRAK